MIRTHDLVACSGVLNLYRLTPEQLNSLLGAIHCQTYRIETRLYIRRSAKHLIANLLAPRYANTPMQEYLDSLEETTFLYTCSNCGELLFFPELQLGEQLTHRCLLEARIHQEYTGRLELLGSGPLRKLVDRHYKLFPLEETHLPLLA